MTEFQSHEPEFDYLKSLEIEEKINKVRWCRSSSNTRMLLSTNDKTVKLWKVRLGRSWGMQLMGQLQGATCPDAWLWLLHAGVREEGLELVQLQH